MADGATGLYDVLDRLAMGVVTLGAVAFGAWLKEWFRSRGNIGANVLWLSVNMLPDRQNNIHYNVGVDLYNGKDMPYLLTDLRFIVKTKESAPVINHAFPEHKFNEETQTGRRSVTIPAHGSLHMSKVGKTGLENEVEHNHTYTAYLTGKNHNDEDVSLELATFKPENDSKIVRYGESHS